MEKNKGETMKLKQKIELFIGKLANKYLQNKNKPKKTSEIKIFFQGINYNKKILLAKLGLGSKSFCVNNEYTSRLRKKKYIDFVNNPNHTAGYRAMSSYNTMDKEKLKLRINELRKKTEEIKNNENTILTQKYCELIPDCNTSKALELRNMTGLGLVECRKAIIQAKGDMKLAQEIVVKPHEKQVIKNV